MRLIKISSIAAILGFLFLTLSYFSSKRLDQAVRYSFPESIARHYSAVSGRVFNGEHFSGLKGTHLRKIIPIDSANPFDRIEIETTAIDIELAPSLSPTNNELEIELISDRVDSTDPISIDTSSGKTLRLLTQEANTDQVQVRRKRWLTFNFDDENISEQNLLRIRLPNSMRNVQIRTVSGDARLATVLENLHYQSKSGDIKIVTDENPLSRVEHLNIETISGDLKSPGRFDRLRFNSVSGDIKLSTLDRVLDIDAQSVSGNLKIQTIDPLDADINFITTSGQFKISPSTGKSGYSRRLNQNSKFKFGTGSTKIKFQSTSGDLKITVKSEADSNTAPVDEGDEARADSYMQCVARIAAREGTRMTSAVAKKCVQIIADTNKSNNSAISFSIFLFG